MPRKNQRRKNANSQSGRRKPKPIKFNQSEIDNEQEEHRATIENDTVDEEQEMEPINGSAPIQADDENTESILSSASDSNEHHSAEQTVEIDDVQNVASITIPVAYTNPFDNRTFNCISHAEIANLHFFLFIELLISL